MIKEVENRIFKISSKSDFSALALEIFRLQSRDNKVYSEYLSHLGIEPDKIESINDIPFLPVEAFKYNRVITGTFDPEVVYRSSGTTGQARSSHHLNNTNLYRQSILNGFRSFYGDPSDYHILALLPSYIERGDSSLVYMVNWLMEESGSGDGGFFLDNYKDLISRISALKGGDRRLLLIGVSFALLELAERFSPDLSGVIVMETGGMKSRGREITRNELHTTLTSSFNVDKIDSEYGMTELLSQAYSGGDGIFTSPPWLKILIRDPLDPFGRQPFGRGGGINIIDLANIYSCSFIETSDLGTAYDGGSFEVSGRFDSSDIRGCNLLAE